MACDFGRNTTIAVESQTRDANKIRDRNNLRADIDLMLDDVRAFVEMAAHSDEAVLRSTGFELRQPRVGAGTSSLLDAPTDLRVKHGRESGTLDVHVNALRDASSCEIANAQGEAVSEADWRHAAISTTSMYVPQRGLTHGKCLWVRVRGINSAGHGLWTPPQRIMVIGPPRTASRPESLRVFLPLLELARDWLRRGHDDAT